MEAYAVLALHHAVRPATPPAARRWAGWTSAAALALGLAGQVAYHLLAASGRTSAPWTVTVLVSAVPVLALGAAAMLWHLLGRPDDRTPSTPDARPASPAVQVDDRPDDRTDAATLDAVRVAGYDLGPLVAATYGTPAPLAVRTANGHDRTATATLDRTDPDAATWDAYDADPGSWTWQRLGDALGCSPEAARGRARRRTPGGGR